MISEASENNIYKQHVGYYLIDEGLHELKEKIGYKNTGIARFEKYNKKE